MDWKPWLAYLTGSVDQELPVRNACLVTENRILWQQITGRVRLSDGERKALAERGTKLGRKVLEEVPTIVTSDTILDDGWSREHTYVGQKT
jgi:putative transposase